MTNPSKVTIGNVAINDPLLSKLGITVTCQSTTLAPGAQTTCTSGTYTVTAADVAAGQIHNVATATGTLPPPPGGGTPPTVTSPPAEVAVPTKPLPAPVQPVPVAALPATGSPLGAFPAAGALALLILGGWLVRRGRRNG
ncbi:hypothetical protein CGZ93_11400 [Enemella dayhoffiae]|uniref:DUF7507 domain-containing protein n=1 Tax=Enemella dayhoffiae TaxID=2016507 RepID=A0A255GZ20_9ACTN|nr:LPXTG cell wall anchor domain-containing protein [Enemella dayhoffiae]OYO20829.1 hypothetical protein CGZ93_11400 [Enemella dayhoffiae]